MSVKRWLDYVEWYPVYVLVVEDDDGPNGVELSEEDLADYDRVMAEFDAWQERLRKMAAPW